MVGMVEVGLWIGDHQGYWDPIVGWLRSYVVVDARVIIRTGSWSDHPGTSYNHEPIWALGLAE